jgi:hypothetical protein
MEVSEKEETSGLFFSFGFRVFQSAVREIRESGGGGQGGGGFAYGLTLFSVGLLHGRVEENNSFCLYYFSLSIYSYLSHFLYHSS